MIMMRLTSAMVWIAKASANVPQTARRSRGKIDGKVDKAHYDREQSTKPWRHRLASSIATSVPAKPVLACNRESHKIDFGHVRIDRFVKCGGILSL